MAMVSMCSGDFCSDCFYAAASAQRGINRRRFLCSSCPNRSVASWWNVSKQTLRRCRSRCVMLTTASLYAAVLLATVGHFDGECVGPERMGTTFPWKRRSHALRCLRAALWTALRTIFRPKKNTRLQDFAYTISKFSPGVVLPDLCRSAPRCLVPDTSFRLALLLLIYEATTARN